MYALGDQGILAGGILSTTQPLFHLMHISGATVTFDYGQALLAGFLCFYHLHYSRVRGNFDFIRLKRKLGTRKIITAVWDTERKARTIELLILELDKKED